jgi:glycosyltransferase involved in cell wall biosynthesis
MAPGGYPTELTRLPEAPVAGLPVLHCYADYKWTGPSGPVVRLCRNLTARGWRSDLVCRIAKPGSTNELAERARDAGLQAFEAFHAHRGITFGRTIRDWRMLKRLLSEGDYALVHCHGSWDHFVAGWVKRLRATDIPVIRTDDGARELYSRWLWRDYFGPKMIDHLIVLADRFRAQAIDRLRRDAGDVTTVRGAIDAGAYGPMVPDPHVRGDIGVDPDAVVIGIVARVQRHRRFETVLEAARMVKAERPDVKIVVCGRGTHKQAVLDRPVRRMGLEDTVLSLGYVADGYRETLAAFDAGLMMVPGSDGSCRAALEMAAMARPLIVAPKGTLPEIVRDGETGIVIHDNAEGLAEAILMMAEDAGRRRQWGTAARERVQRLFSPDRQADQVIGVYERLLGRAP